MHKDKDLLEALLNQVICKSAEGGITTLSSLTYNFEHPIFKQIMASLLDFETGDLDSYLMGLGFEEIEPGENIDLNEALKIQEVKSLLRKEFIYKLLLITMQKEIELLKKQHSISQDQPLQVQTIPTPRCERVARIPTTF